MNSKLFVGNLSWETSEDDLKEHFGQVGDVESVRIIVDQMTKKSKGFGFVEMKSPEDAKKAIEQLDEKELKGRSLRVSIALDRNAREGGGGGGQKPYRGDRERSGSGGQRFGRPRMG
jgi:RNA recognition motif-containing protein